MDRPGCGLRLSEPLTALFLWFSLLLCLSQLRLSKHHRMGGLKNRILFSHGSRDRKVQDQGPSEFSFWSGFSSHCPYLPGRERHKSLNLIIPLLGPHPHGLITSPKSHLQIPSLWGFGLQHELKVGDRHCAPPAR